MTCVNGGTLQAPPSPLYGPRPSGLLALLMGHTKLKIPCQNSAVRKNAGLATTREPLYFGPRLPKMAKVAKIGCETVVG